MTNRDRVQAVLNFERPDDRLPVLEWATWWDRTVKAWQGQGMPALNQVEMYHYFGLDDHRQFWFNARTPEAERRRKEDGELVWDEDDYEKLLPYLYDDRLLDSAVDTLQALKPAHDRGDFPVWFSMDGGFWYPRTLFGITRHLYSFYDQPELYHRMLDDLAEYQLRCLQRMFDQVVPEFMTLAEDMSYNLGPMLSESTFDEFLLPYYNKVVPFIRDHGVKVIIDTDGNVTRMIPWLRRAGIQGVLPLEHQAGVDVAALREAYPDFLLVGGYDKMVMRPDRDESAMRGEFERLLPVMKQGGFIASVDHQTPPDCPMDRYRRYLALAFEYAERAVRE